ncbi:MAG: hypothetical protein LQ346_003788 [Caloplaca aetnensis]|nr:MAG: hypothetical protein LQ346_003788 [Caloplaca aetnensis]
MLSPLFLGLVVLHLPILQVSATQFCQCEHPAKPEWKFGGIQHICRDLPDEWCSTNCDFFHGNCDYCQYTPAGQGPDADYQQLVSWCRKQSEWDSGAKRYIHGTDVICYSYRNRIPPKIGYTGCRHEDNGDYPRDTTAYFSSRLVGGWYQRRGCRNLQRFDWGPLADDFIKKNPQCQAINNATWPYQLDCPYSDNPKDNLKQRADFRSDCEHYKGEWFLRHDGPTPRLSQDNLHKGLLQQPLSNPELRLSPSINHPDIEPEKDVQWDAREPNSGREGNRANKVKQGHSSHEGSRRVVFEEDDVRVILVEEDY